MNSIHQPESYYDSARSPRGDTQPSSTIHRQSSRQFENFGPPPDGLYVDGLGQRYDTPRYDRMNPLQNPYNSFDMGMPQAWNNTGYSHSNNLAGINATTRVKPGATRGRPALPSWEQMWMDQPGQALPASNGFGPFGNAPLGVPAFRADHGSPEGEEDLIPTAIVIKNIPFAVKKEQLVQVMTELNLPLPYAFNYHFDNGVFRGLAFANFTTAEETATVIQAMNHLELHGRKLRVEYKKMLPQAERDRIEREKRERRGQLEEQHRPVNNAQLQSRPSVSSMTSAIRAVSPTPNAPPPGLDMNDSTTLDYYSKLILFKSDQSKDSISFPSQTLPQHRTIIHGLAHYLQLGHESIGAGEQRQVYVFKNPGGSAGLSPSVPQSNFDPNRRGLYRAATTDFSDVRDAATIYGPVGRQSSGFLGFPEPQTALSASNNLRTAKSFADLRSFTPSPSHSNSSFPPSLAANAAAARYNDLGQSSPGSNRQPAMTPGTGATTGSSDVLVNGMSGMNLNSGFSGRQTSPSRLRSVMSWEREAPGPIGGHRVFNNAASTDDQSKARAHNGTQNRQGRNSAIERGTGFSRGRPNGHQSRGSDELLPHNGIDTVVE